MDEERPSTRITISTRMKSFFEEMDREIEQLYDDLNVKEGIYNIHTVIYFYLNFAQSFIIRENTETKLLL
jgi:hypothetical protein